MNNTKPTKPVKQTYLVMLKKTTGDEPFAYYVFTERANEEIAKLIIDDVSRYDKVFEVTDAFADMSELTSEMEMGVFASKSIIDKRM